MYEQARLAPENENKVTRIEYETGDFILSCIPRIIGTKVRRQYLLVHSRDITYLTTIANRLEITTTTILHLRYRYP